MEKYERIRDEEVFQVIEAVAKDENLETLNREIAITKLKLLVDIRQFLRKMYKNMPKKVKTYKRPTNNKNDVITGN